MRSIDDKIRFRMQKCPKTHVWCNKDFLDFGRRAAVDQALGRMVKAGDIRRVARGIYHLPRFSAVLDQEMSPSYDQIAKAIARRLGVKIQPSGALSANMLGLSEQVPSKVVYHTDGRNRQVKIGNSVIRFQNVPPGKLGVKNEISVMLPSAIRFMGKNGVSEIAIARSISKLSRKECMKLLRTSKYFETWIYETIKRAISTKYEDI